jgi:chromosome segregation ATPase
LQAFGAQLATALAALDQLPGKFRETEASFGGEIGRSAGELDASARRMSSALEHGQASLAATLAAFEEKIGAIPARLAAATEQSSQELGAHLGASLRQTLDGAATAAQEASHRGSEIMSARMGEMSDALTSVAALLAQAGQTSHERMAEGAKLLSESSEVSAERLSSTVATFSLAVNRLASRLDEVERGLDAQNRRLASAGEIVSGASDNLAKAAGAMESASVPLTTATLSFQDAMDRFSQAASEIQLISASGDSIGAHISAFGAQMTQSLAAFDALPEKIKATEGGFGAEIGKSAAHKHRLRTRAIGDGANFGGIPGEDRSPSLLARRGIGKVVAGNGREDAPDAGGRRLARRRGEPQRRRHHGVARWRNHPRPGHGGGQIAGGQRGLRRAVAGQP